jgi:hypothetical protein
MKMRTFQIFVVMAVTLLLCMWISDHSYAQNAMKTVFDMNGCYTIPPGCSNPYQYQELTAPADYQISAGDYLQYSVCWTSLTDAISFQLTCTDGSIFWGTTTVDQNGVPNGAWGAPYSPYTNNIWYTRYFYFPSGWVGKTLAVYSVACENDNDVTVTTYFDMIFIGNSGTQKRLIWQSGSSMNNTPYLVNGNTHVVSFSSVAIPTITGTTPGSRCGTGTVTLGATPSAGSARWWSAITGGTLLYTGNSFTTPSISATTTYYVEAVNPVNFGCPSKTRTAVVATVNVPPTATVSGKSNISCYAGNNGSITITAGSGTGPYQYSIYNGNTGTYQSGNAFSGLTAGTYYPRVKDALGCESPTCP